MEWKELGEIKILIVEDDPFNRLLIRSLLEKFTQIEFLEASDGLEALKILETQSIDLMFLALHLPKMNANELLTVLEEKKICESMAILLMTTEKVLKEDFTKKGIDDCVSKPFVLEELEKKIYQNLIRKRKLYNKNKEAQDLDSQTAKMYSKTQIQLSQQDFFLKMISLKTKANTAQRIQAKVIALIAKEFALKLGYDNNMSQYIYYASLIRDIGVIALPLAHDENKVFSDEDKKIFQEYILLGYDMLSGAIETDFIRISKLVILHYKEAHDGSGMPYSIQEDAIPEVAVIVAISETFEALLSKRTYRTPIQYTTEEAYTILLNSQTRFKPKVLKIFLHHFLEFVTLRQSIINIANT
ncbi:Response regulator [hydrothermal vent metagenome]|uniref:Response regulator n=1 Tax=hydrothermal vent metagenome TaxID=652676 RepID=A0A1W1C2U9_9ZZZZ